LLPALNLSPFFFFFSFHGVPGEIEMDRRYCLFGFLDAIGSVIYVPHSSIIIIIIQLYMVLSLSLGWITTTIVSVWSCRGDSEFCIDQRKALFGGERAGGERAVTN
jgi:hypothetical protein